MFLCKGVYKLFNKCLVQHLNNHKLILSTPDLMTVLTLSVDLLRSSNYAVPVLADFASQILTVTAVVKLFLDLKQPQTEAALNECNLACRLYPLLTNKETGSFIQGKSFLEAISFLANLCSIELMDFESFKLNVDNFLIISTEIIDYCSSWLHEASLKSGEAAVGETVITWTPLFGFLRIKFASPASLDELLGQLRFLWSHKFIMLLFLDSKAVTGVDTAAVLTKANFKSYLRGIFDKTTFSSQPQKQLLSCRESVTVYRICTFYKKILVLISEPKIEILSALSFEEEFLLGLWRYMLSLGPQCGVKELVSQIVFLSN